MNEARDADEQMDLVRQEAMAFAGIGLYRFDFDGVVRSMDRQTFLIYELEDHFPDHHAVEGKFLNEILHYVGAAGTLRKEIREKGRVRGREWHFRTLADKPKWIVEDAYLVLDPETGGESIQVLARDITPEKQAEAALERAARLSDRLGEIISVMHQCHGLDELLTPLLNAALDVCSMDAGVVYIIENDEAVIRRYAGVSDDFAASFARRSLSLPAAQAIIQAAHPIRIDTLASAVSGRFSDFGLRRVYAVPLRTADTVFGFLVVASRQDADPDESSVKLLGVLAMEVASLFTRLRYEEALVESERKYRAILDNIQEGYYEVDLMGDLTFANKALCRVFGYSEDEIIGINYQTYYAGATSVDHVNKTYRQVYDTGQPVQVFDWQAVRKDGGIVYLEVSISLICDADGRKTGFRGIARDVTEHRTALLALRESEERYRELFENANDVVYTHDLEGRFTSMNKVGELLSAYTREELLGRRILDMLPPDEREMAHQQIQRKLAGEPPTRYEVHVTAKDGHLIPLEVSTRIIKKDGQPVAVQGIARDISERKQAEADRARLEAQIRHSQKLESLGVLAGGIAHDFNNLLVGMLGYVGLAMGKVPAESPLRSYLERIETSAQRAAELTSQMLAYSGKGTFVVRPLNLSKLVEEVGRLLSASVSKMAVIEYRCDPNLPPIVADPTQLHQVVMNIMTNASDAIGHQPGTITLVTGVVEIDHAYLAEIYMADDMPEGRYVYLEVTDTGCGMDTETQARIFDPFFTTKFQGRGLGLAAVLGIVRSHRGAIKVYSEPGHGTTFKLLFPAAACSQPEVPSAEEDMLREQLRTWRRGGTIIVADDEEYARSVAKEALEGHGFTVHTAHNGREAIELLRENTHDVVGILLDLTMPVMGGDEAFGHLRAIRPDVPIILSSGYSEGDCVRRFEGRGPSAFIQKPYVLMELTAKFHDVLEHTTP